MRIALLTAHLPGLGDNGGAETPFAGQAVLLHQLDAALAFGCEKVLCLADGTGAVLPQAAERCRLAGVDWEMASTPAGLLASVTAGDEVLVVEPGLLFDAALLRELANGRAQVLALPIDPGLAAGFERLDAQRAWAGIALTRGSVLQGLADLPEDVEPSSCLLRLALQAGAQVVPVGPQVIGARQLWFPHKAQHDEADEQRWLHNRARPVSFSLPGRATVERVTLRLAPRLLQRPASTLWAQILVVIAAVAALALSWFGWTGAALLALVVAHGVLLAWRMLSRLATYQAVSSDGRLRGRSIQSAPGVVLDLILGVVLAHSGWLGGTGDADRWFVTAVLLMLLPLLSKARAPIVRAVARDRLSLLLALVLASLTGVLGPVLRGLVLAGVAVLLWEQHRAKDNDALTP